MAEGQVPSSPDFLVLGLGNPGPRYAETRHNFGFFVVDRLAADARASFRAGPGPVVVCPLSSGRGPGLLAKPTVFMNRSGVAARSLLARWGEVPFSRLLVVIDDLDLPLGRIRFRREGGDGGHQGLSSVIEELETEDFPRLRVGIGRPGAAAEEDVVDWVLEPFPEEERDLVTGVTDRAAEGVRVFATEGIEAAMNRFNAPRTAAEP
jgi:PTH1 family peptidyl-tRNA hydrolase